MSKNGNLVYVPARAGKLAGWMTDVTLNWKRVRRFAGSTKQEAQAYLAKLRLAAREGRLEEMIRPRPTKPTGGTFGEYGRALLDSAEWKAKRSASRNEISFEHLRKSFKDVGLADINAGRVRAYMTKRRAEGKSPATVNRELSLLKSILYAAEYDGLIASNPIRGRRVKKLEEPESRDKAILNLDLSEEDQRRLIDAAVPHFRPILTLALVAGMRQGEILKMRWKDVDFRLGSIRVPAENAKTKRERIVPLDATLAAELDSLDRKGEFVFMNETTGDRRRNVAQAFRAACERAEIPSGRPDGLTFHDCRHIAAFRLVKLTDIVTASRILGHADVKMTMRYCHSSDRDKREAIEKASGRLLGPRQNPVNEENQLVQKELENKAQIN